MCGHNSFTIYVWKLDKFVIFVQLKFSFNSNANGRRLIKHWPFYSVSVERCTLRLASASRRKERLIVNWIEKVQKKTAFGRYKIWYKGISIYFSSTVHFLVPRSELPERVRIGNSPQTRGPKSGTLRNKHTNNITSRASATLCFSLSSSLAATACAKVAGCSSWHVMANLRGVSSRSLT